MSDDTTAAKPTTRDHLLLIFAGVLAHPATFGRVAEHVDDGVVAASHDPACAVLWAYFQRVVATAESTATGVSASGGGGRDDALAFSRYEAFAELVAADVPDAARVMESMVDAALELTPRKIVATAKKLTRSMVNSRRREHVKRECETTPVAVLDVEAIAEDAARRYPHTSTSIKPLTADGVAATMTKTYTVIPTGFAPLDRHFDGFIVGEFHLMPARTGDNKSTLTYSLVRNQLFANAARHRDDPWWEQFGSEWRQHGRCGRRDVLLQPLHAGHDGKDDVHLAPHLLWFSLEEPVAQVIGRFYCDLLTLDRGAWVKKKSYRENTSRSYAQSIEHINNVLGSGRLTIVDYCERPRDAGVDVEFVEQTLADITKKWRAWVRECERRDAEESEREGHEIKRPRLCLIDYAQLVQIPDDRAREQHAVLDKVSTSLRRLAATTHTACVAPVMLLRDRDNTEPSKDAIKGSSQFAQDAARIFTLWPLHKRERTAIKAALSLAEQRAGMMPATDQLAADEWDEIDAPSEGTHDMPEAPPNIAALHLRRALGELRLAGEKDRFGDADWTIRLHVDGKHARVTEALPDIDDTGCPVHVDDDGNIVGPEHEGARHYRYSSYREHPTIRAVLTPPRPRKGKDKD